MALRKTSTIVSAAGTSFLSGDSYSATSEPNGADTDVTMTGPSGTATVTFTDAELAAYEQHNVVPPNPQAVPEDGEWGGYAAVDGGGWFYNNEVFVPADNEYTLKWVVNGLVVGTGLSYTLTSSAQLYEDIYLVVTPQYGDPVSVQAQVAPDYAPNLIRPSDSSSKVIYSGAGELADYAVFACSLVMDSSFTSVFYPFRTYDGANSRTYLRQQSENSGGELLFYWMDEDGTPLSGSARTGDGKAGLTVAVLVTATKGGAVTFNYKDSGGGSGTSSTTLPAGKRLGIGSEIRMGAVQGVISTSQYRMAYWSRSAAPAGRTPIQLLGDLFDADAKPRNPAIANTYLGQPRWDVNSDAASVNTGAQSGTWVGTGTRTGSFIDI